MRIANGISNETARHRDKRDDAMTEAFMMENVGALSRGRRVHLPESSIVEAQQRQASEKHVAIMAMTIN